MFRLKTALVISQTELLYSLLRINLQSSAGQRRDRHLEELTWESNCFSHNLSIRPPAFVSTVPSLPIVPATAGNCLALGCTGKGIVFLFFPAYWLIISFSWDCSSHFLPFLHLLSGFQNIFAVVSSPFLSLSLRVCILYKLKDWCFRGVWGGSRSNNPCMCPPALPLHVHLENASIGLMNMLVEKDPNRHSRALDIQIQMRTVSEESCDCPGLHWGQFWISGEKWVVWDEGEIERCEKGTGVREVKGER